MCMGSLEFVTALSSGYSTKVISCSLFAQVISLGDIIKFSLSPSKSKDRLSANVSGVPLDERNLVRHKPTVLLIRFSSSKSYEYWKPCFGRL